MDGWVHPCIAPLFIWCLCVLGRTSRVSRTPDSQRGRNARPTQKWMSLFVPPFSNATSRDLVHATRGYFNAPTYHTIADIQNSHILPIRVFRAPLCTIRRIHYVSPYSGTRGPNRQIQQIRFIWPFCVNVGAKIVSQGIIPQPNEIATFPPTCHTCHDSRFSALRFLVDFDFFNRCDPDRFWEGGPPLCRKMLKCVWGFYKKYTFR